LIAASHRTHNRLMSDRIPAAVARGR